MMVDHTTDSPSPRKLKSRSVVAFTGLAALLAVSCSSPPQTVDSQTFYQGNTCLRPSCEEVLVTRGDVSSITDVTGSLRYVHRADLSFKGDGEVVSVSVSVGDAVRKGQELAGLKKPMLQLAVSGARLALRSAEEALGELFKGPTSSDLLSAEAKVSAARDYLRQSQTALEIAQLVRK